MTRTVILPALAVLALVGGCRGDGANGPIVTSGHVEATEVRVATKVGGTLSKLEVDEGDVVTVGQVLARIDTTDSDLALERAQGELAMAEAELRLRLAGARHEDVAVAEAQVERAEAEFKTAERDLERMEGLLERGSGTTKGRDDARLRRDVTAAALASARENLAKLRAGSRAEEIDAARAHVRAAKAFTAQLEQQIADATIASPVAGVVTEKMAEAGELAVPGAALLVVTELARPWLTVYVAEPDLARIRVGQEVEVTTDDGTRRTGQLSFIASKAEFTPKNVQTRDERVKLVYRLKVRLPNDDGLFKPGMPAEASIAPVVEP